MKIAYIPSRSDPYSKHSWSGTDYYTRKALEDQGHEVYCIYNYEVKPSWKLQLRKVIEKLKGFSYDVRRSWEASKKHAEIIQDQLQRDTDLIFSLGTIKVASLNTDLPIYLMVDSIFEMHRTFYGGSGSDKTNKECNEIEKQALTKCTKVISCSKVTAEFINKFYTIPLEKIDVVPLGANWDENPQKEVVFDAISKRSCDICKILFVGVEWFRKGADIVLETVRLLHDEGMNIELHLCGLREIPVDLPPYVINHGFLRKSDEKESKLLNELFLTSHFLFVPSRAEAFGLVFCEASAYGLPSISFREGGLITTIVDGINGQLFEMDAKPSDFAKYIKTTFEDQDDYTNLCHSSYQRYCDYLNWNSSGKALSTIIQDQKMA